MPLLDTEPVVIVRNVLVDNWDSSNIDETFKPAWINTGWWDEETPNPQITLTETSEDTSPDGIHPGGKGLTSWVDGSIDCNVWVPYDRDNYASQGVAKGFRWDLVKEIHRIIENHQTGTTDDSGNAELTRLETGNIQRDPADPPPPFRALIPIGFQYHTRPE